MEYVNVARAYEARSNPVVGNLRLTCGSEESLRPFLLLLFVFVVVLLVTFKRY